MKIAWQRPFSRFFVVLTCDLFFSQILMYQGFVHLRVLNSFRTGQPFGNWFSYCYRWYLGKF